MNLDILHKAEDNFFSRYPGGFYNPEMIAIGKKHKVDQMQKQARESFAKGNFSKPGFIVEEAAKLVSRSSMVSVFEKPKFRDYAKSLTPKEKEQFADALYELLHGKQEQGFEQLVELLKKHKLAKWTLVSVFPAYYNLQKEVFVKPTTAKLIVEKLGLDLKYSATPSWAFYKGYRKAVNEMKGKVDKSLAPNNPAFCGFLMMSL